MNQNNRADESERVLFAVLGMSPAVLTETVWALARETPPVIPHRVVVLTTTQGRVALERELFSGGESCGWNRLCAALVRAGIPTEGRLAFGLAADHVRLFPHPSGRNDLADIATTADNEAAADFILRELRAFTENPQTVVLASIAGGRKTMSALMMSCMSLLGRMQDRLLHVLVNPPFDGPLNPPFLFPEKGRSHTDREGRAWRATAARVSLVDVPFVRMRGWYEGAFKNLPPGYAALVRGVQSESPLPLNAPVITLDRAAGEVRVDGAEPLRLSPSEFGVFLLLFAGTSDQQALADAMVALAAKPLRLDTPDWVARLQSGGRFSYARGSGTLDVEGVRKCLSSARAKIRHHTRLAPFADALVPFRGKSLGYPHKRIIVTGPDVFAIQ